MSSYSGDGDIPNAVYRCSNDCTFQDFISQHKNDLALSIADIPNAEMTYQIELALKFMQFHSAQDNHGNCDEPNSDTRVIIDSRKSVFEIILDLHCSIQALRSGFDLYVSGGDSSKSAFIRKLQDFNHFNIGTAMMLNIPKTDLPISYCTMIVFDSSDIESATDVLANAWFNCSVPWVIRNLLVQETIQKKFIELLASKLKPFCGSVQFQEELSKAVAKASKLGLRVIQNPKDSNELKPTVILGSSVEFFLEVDSREPSPVIIMNIFRTAKEAISLADKTSGGSVSVWTEELCLSMEVAYDVSAPCVWVNSHGIFNPAFPYTFRQNDYCYGSDYAIYERQIKRVFVPQPQDSVNSVARNKAAIESLGKIPIKVEKQRYTHVMREKNIHYEMLSSPYNVNQYNENHQLKIVNGFSSKFVTNDNMYRHLVLDTVLNQRKTVVIPYGVSFGN